VDAGLIPALSDLAKRFMSETEARASIQVYGQPSNSDQYY
jgi:hypothetical protein